MQNTGFLQLFDSQAEYDIGDLTLRLRRGTTESEQFFQSIYEMGDFSYVAPFRNPEQLGEFQMDDYRNCWHIWKKIQSLIRLYLILELGFHP